MVVMMITIAVAVAETDAGMMALTRFIITSNRRLWCRWRRKSPEKAGDDDDDI